MKKLLSIICAAAISAGGFTAMAQEPEREELFGNEVFSESKISLYNDEDTEGYISEIWENFGAIAAMGSGWDEKNGIKADITDAVKGYSGSTFEVSVDVTLFAWTYDLGGGNLGVNPAQLFFKTVGESGEGVVTLITEGPGSAEDIHDNIANLSGSAELRFNEGDKVYLCVTHPSGVIQVHDLSVSVLNDEKLFGNEIFTDGSFTIYDDADTTGMIEEVWDNFGIQAKLGRDWDDNNGVKTDITEYVKDRSGCYFKLSTDVTTWLWTYDAGGGELGVNKAKAFFLVKGNNGDSIIPITEGPGSADAIADNTAAISGSAKLSFNEGDTVYLCFTHGSGMHQYKNITFAVCTPDKIIGNEIFSKGFEIYDNENAPGSIVTIWDNFGMSAEFKDSWNENNGVKLNITKYVAGRSGEYFDASVDVTSFAWSSILPDETEIINKARIFVQVVDAEGKTSETELCSGPDDKSLIADNAATLSGGANVSFNEGDSVYLCLVQGGAVEQYKNISFGVTRPAAGITVSTPVLNGEKAAVTSSNGTDSDADVIIYIASYNDGVLSGIEQQTITVPAGAVNETYEFDAEAGNRVYIWDVDQTPFTEATEI